MDARSMIRVAMIDKHIREYRMSKVSARALLAATASMLAGGIATSADAAAFYLQEQSVRGAGRAFSGEVADQGAASLWWNPAAIGGMTGGDAVLGVSRIMPRGDVHNNGTVIVRPGQAPAPVGGNADAHNPINNGTLPSGAVAYALTPRLSLGLAVTSPFSFTTNYKANSWVRYTADKTSLRMVDLQPTLAFAITPEISVGAGPNIEYVKASLSNFLPNLSPLLPDGHQTLKGNGWDWGWSAGAQFHGGPFTIGLSYKSSIKHTLDGQVITAGLFGPLAGQNRTIDTKANFRTPWQAALGARVKATPKLTVDGQIVRFGWKKFDTINLGAPLNVAIPENYGSTWSYALGADYAVTPNWTVRAGIQRDETPTRDKHRDARVPDSDRWNFAAGTSVAVTKSIGLDAAVNYIDFKNASIDRTTAAYAGTPVQTPILVNGTLRNAHALVLSLGAHLSF
jgi:long-chain fatty acid transport protein